VEMKLQTKEWHFPDECMLYHRSTPIHLTCGPRGHARWAPEIIRCSCHEVDDLVLSHVCCESDFVTAAALIALLNRLWVLLRVFDTLVVLVALFMRLMLEYALRSG
jgi:hypothetical protein